MISEAAAAALFTDKVEMTGWSFESHHTIVHDYVVREVCLGTVMLLKPVRISKHLKVIQVH